MLTRSFRRLPRPRQGAALWFAIVAALVLAAAPEGHAAPGSTVLDGILDDGHAAAEVSTAELVAALADPATVVLDARAPEEYAVSHIPGALNVPGKPGLAPSLYTADVGAVQRLVPDLARRVILYCNGLHCGRSRRLAADLIAAGYQNVRRYQLGIPAWRALGGATQVEKEALVRILAVDGTAVLVDARPRDRARRGLRGARHIPLADTTRAKDDGRLPMADHATRIFVVGDSAAQARAVADAIFRDAFHNVSFYAGTPADLSALAARTGAR
jgi:rhodanese-related sulfurtransferase